MWPYGGVGVRSVLLGDSDSSGWMETPVWWLYLHVFPRLLRGVPWTPSGLLCGHAAAGSQGWASLSMCPCSQLYISKRPSPFHSLRWPFRYLGCLWGSFWDPFTSKSSQKYSKLVPPSTWSCQPLQTFVFVLSRGQMMLILRPCILSSLGTSCENNERWDLGISRSLSIDLPSHHFPGDERLGEDSPRHGRRALVNSASCQLHLLKSQKPGDSSVLLSIADFPKFGFV